MPVATSIDIHGFAQLLTAFGQANRITIVTHSFGIGHQGPLKKALASIPRNCELTIISCIPCCRMNFLHEDTQTNRKNIADYYRSLNPSNFGGTPTVWLSHHNHAKIVICDHLAYVGSANFTPGSARSFEAGYITDHADDLSRLRAFVEQVKERSIPYGHVGASVVVQRLLQFAADVRWLVEEITSHNCEDELIYKDVVRPRFILSQFGLPARTIEIIRAAAVEVANLDAKAELDAAEEPMYDAGVTVRLAHVVEAMESILNRDQLPKAISSDEAAVDLYEKYLYSEDPGSDPALIAEADEIAETNEKKRYQIARSELRAFVRLLFLARRDIFSAVGLKS